jgi:hypothetical protein
MSNVAQVRRLNYNGEDIGMGFNSDTGLAVGTALDFTPPQEVLSQEAQSDISIITSHEELMSKLHMSAQLEGRYSFVSAGGKVDFAKNTQYNSSSTFVVGNMVITNTVSRGKDFRPKAEIQNLLAPGQTDAFERAFGDSFVRAHFKGGEFYAVMRLTSVDAKTESNLAITLHAEAQGAVASGSFQGQLNQANSSENTCTDFSVQFYQKGGAGEDEIGTTLDVEEIKKRLKTFPDAVKNHAFPYFIEVATYDTVPVPVPSKEQQEDFLLALNDADQKKLKFLQLKNDCEFAAEHPEFFSNPPTKPVLLAAAETFLQLVNGAIDHAVKLSNGQLNPPTLFDPAKLVPPVTVPDITLRKRDVGSESSFADWWTHKDLAATLQNDRDLVTDIGLLAIPEINDFNGIVDPSGDPAQTQRLQGEALGRVVASLQGYSWDHAGMHATTRGKLTSLAKLPTMLPRSIKSLSFVDNRIVDTKGLDEFQSLVSLDLSHNTLGAIDELSALRLLKWLSLVDNSISDLTPLRNCVSLETLDLSGNDIADLSPLAACQRLKNLTLTGTTLFRNGVPTRSGNPITVASALAAVPGLANPLFLGKVLAVRFGDLTQGPTAQFVGTATRVGDSASLKVHLTRGAEVMDDVWTLRTVSAVEPGSNSEMSTFFPGTLPSDFPMSGSSISVVRASQAGKPFDLNFAYVDRATPGKAVVAVDRFPVFASKVKLPSFDAVVQS